MKIALTGATGRIGRGLCALPYDITSLGRHAVTGHSHIQWDLRGPAPDLTEFDTLIHCAFSHVPGRYRGGEGNDPEGFLAANVAGTKRLFDAMPAGRRVIFLSSRAVFDALPDDTPLTESTPPKARSLYGQAKIEVEQYLASLPLGGMSLRATGVYGPGPAHKWAQLFRDYHAGRVIAPRCGTELHIEDLAQAIALLIRSKTYGVAHASDILLDRHDLFALVQEITDYTRDTPNLSTQKTNPLICKTLPELGWRPGGFAKLRATLPRLLAEIDLPSDRTTKKARGDASGPCGEQRL